MRKNDLNIAIGVAGLAAAILLSSPKKDNSDSGYGGFFPIPPVQGAGTQEAVAIGTTPIGTQSNSFQISDKILAAMAGIIQPATSVYGGSTPQAKKELTLIQSKGFSIEGLQGSYDPETRTAYTFAETPTKKETSTIAYTKGLMGGFDASFGFGLTSPQTPAPTKKEASAIDMRSEQQGGATVFSSARRGSVEGTLYYPGGATTLGVGEVIANMKAKGYTNIHQINTNTYGGTR